MTRPPSRQNRFRGELLILAFAAIVPLLGAAAEPGPEIQASALTAACAARPPTMPAWPGVSVSDAPAKSEDLPYLQIKDARTGSTARIYYSADSRQLAEARAACWAGVLSALAEAIPDPRRDLVWAPLVLTSDPGYVPPRGGSEHRWKVSTAANASASFDKMLLLTMPHEEVHESQATLRTHLPRWFQEGHAEWAGMKVTEVVRPDLAAAERARLAAALERTPQPKLRDWGGMTVKPEAIRRQLSPADRDRLDHDPTFKPAGPFSFGPDDLVSDETNMDARYAAALRLFDALERRHGAAAVRAWIGDVLQSGDASPELLARRELGEDLAPRLQ